MKRKNMEINFSNMTEVKNIIQERKQSNLPKNIYYAVYALSHTVEAKTRPTWYEQGKACIVGFFESRLDALILIGQLKGQFYTYTRINPEPPNILITCKPINQEMIVKYNLHDIVPERYYPYTINNNASIGLRELLDPRPVKNN